MAFTDEQNEQIRNDLIRAARRCGITIGMRKTSVEQLTEAVGISKGSFYKFFDSKELLFFTVLEHPYRVLRGSAEVLAGEYTPASCRTRGSGDLGCLPLALQDKSLCVHRK